LREEAFEIRWRRYPNQVGKKDALKHFLASVQTDKDLEASALAKNDPVAFR
jgi:hypothetical protein